MAHLPTVRHYYVVYMAGRTPFTPSPPLLSSTLSPPLLHSIFPSLLHHTTLHLSCDPLLLPSGDLLLPPLLPSPPLTVSPPSSTQLYISHAQKSFLDSLRESDAGAII